MSEAYVPTDETYGSGNTFSITGVARLSAKYSIYSRPLLQKKNWLVFGATIMVDVVMIFVCFILRSR